MFTGIKNSSIGAASGAEKLSKSLKNIPKLEGTGVMPGVSSVGQKAAKSAKVGKVGSSPAQEITNVGKAGQTAGKGASGLMQIAVAALAFAGAMALMAGSLWLVAQIPAKDLLNASFAVAALSFILTSSMFALSALSAPISIGVGVLLAFGAALLMTAGAFYIGALAIEKIIQSIGTVDPMAMLSFGLTFGLLAGSLALGAVTLLVASQMLIPMGLALAVGLGGLVIAALIMSKQSKSFSHFGEGLKIFTDSIVNFGSAFSDGSIMKGISGLKQTVK